MIALKPPQVWGAHDYGLVDFGKIGYPTQSNSYLLALDMLFDTYEKYSF